MMQGMGLIGVLVQAKVGVERTDFERIEIDLNEVGVERAEVGVDPVDVLKQVLKYFLQALASTPF
jgi:hypothetical protein